MLCRMLFYHVFVLMIACPSFAQGDARAVLKQMHDHLINSSRLEFESSVHVASDVLGVSRRGTTHFIIQQPNRFRVEASSNNKTFIFVSDGNVLTLYRPEARKFAQVHARKSIIGTMYLAAGLLNIEARLLDFLWTVNYGDDVSVSASGSGSVRGRECSRFNVDRFEDKWEVWLDKTGVPLPCKLVSRRTDGNARVVQTNELSWKANPVFSTETFDFTPPKGSRKVDVSDLE